MKVDLHKLIQRFIRRFMRAPGATKVAPSPPVYRLPATHIDAARSLVQRGTVDTIPYSNRVLKTSTEGTHPLLLEFSRAFLKELKRRGIPMIPFEYVRDKERQNALYLQGVSKAKWGESPHNHGMAVDIVHYQKFWNLTNKQWAVLGLIGKEVARKRGIDVTWGGDWNFYDPAHWELADWPDRIGWHMEDFHDDRYDDPLATAFSSEV